MADLDHTAAVDPTIQRVDEVTGALETLSDVLGQEEELPGILHRVCEQVVHAIPGADIASITLLRDGEAYTAAATDRYAIDIDLAQYDAGQGPCLEAAITGQVVRVAVPEAAQRWPEFAAAAGTATVASYLSAPLFIDSEYHGSLNLYGEDAHGFGKLDAALLELYTAATEAALRGARRYLRVRDTTEQLRAALTSRAVIEQAKGVIMAIHSIPADEAFAVLVEHSQARNEKVRDIAEQFIDSILADDTSETS